MILGLIMTFRPRQLAKNGLVLVPLFFTVNIWWAANDWPGMTAIVARALAAFVVFALLSGSVYTLNDIMDREADRAHPRKRRRPIAAGVVPVGVAGAVAGVAGGGALAAAFLIALPLGYTLVGYLALNTAYSYVLKHLVILDVMSVAGGFILRAVAGAFAIDHAIVNRNGGPVELDLTISPWLYLVTGLGALFIALSKRRSELQAAGDNSEAQRAILREYDLPMLDQMAGIVATATLVAYTLYTFSSGAPGDANVPDNNSMMLTIPFVVYGLFRYLYLVHIKGSGESPEEILITDKPIIINIGLWLATAAAVLFFNR
jgi:4-hydroxybenzoate polyprenyltransferase